MSAIPTLLQKVPSEDVLSPMDIYLMDLNNALGSQKVLFYPKLPILHIVVDVVPSLISDTLYKTQLGQSATRVNHHVTDELVTLFCDKRLIRQMELWRKRNYWYVAKDAPKSILFAITLRNRYNNRLHEPCQMKTLVKSQNFLRMCNTQ